ncbi:hypothetical protein MRX96_020244 [Rhipicephalus microplus]
MTIASQGALLAENDILPETAVILKYTETPYVIKRRQWEALQQEDNSTQENQATQRRVTLKRSSRWDRQRSGSTQRKHRDRSSSFRQLGTDSYRKSSGYRAAQGHLPLLLLRQVYSTESM